MNIKRSQPWAITMMFWLAAVATGLAQNQRPVLEDSREHRVLKVTPASLESTRASHPLEPLMQIATTLHERLNVEVQDYTCVLVKRERIDGELLPFEHVAVKFRGHRPDDGSGIPFSVYVKVLAPRPIEGREVLFVEGEHDGEMLVTRGGRRRSSMTFSIRPQGKMAQRDNRYPITEFGIENLLYRILEVAKLDIQYDECDVRTIPNTKVDGRSCTLFEVVHPERRRHFLFHVARIFVDEEQGVPVRFAAYDWPEEEGGDPVLLEEYTFRDIQFNVGLSDRDFAHDNPEYEFQLID